LDKENVYPSNTQNQPPLINKSLLTTKTSKWTNEALDEVMDVDG
jgi:hypothetical protein